MSAITTHILDTARGLPAIGVPIALETKSKEKGGEWKMVGMGRTDDDGRLNLAGADGALAAGLYRLTFETGAYFTDTGQAAFYPEVQITFTVTETAQHYHIPLLLCPYGYSTYRGS